MTTTLQFPAESSDEILAEVHKCFHIFQGRTYQFALSDATHLPLLVDAPVELPYDSPFVCFYGNPMTRNLTVAHGLFEAIQLNNYRCFSGIQLSAIETIGHFFRHSAVLEADSKKRKVDFKRAMTLYTNVVQSYGQKSIRDAVQCNKAQLCMTYPEPNNVVPSDDRRRISHCFAGMALCALMGERSPTLFFSYSSAALAWEPFRRVELSNVLRIHMLLVGKFDMHLVSLHRVASKPAGQSWEFAPVNMQQIDELMGFTPSSMVNLPAVYDQVCKSLVLPMLLLHGDAVDQERGIIRPSDWDAAMDGAKKIVTRYNVVKCAHCSVHETNRKFLRCSACHVVYYCCVGCQHSNWKSHKSACKKVKK
jgi:hypothetical protein